MRRALVFVCAAAGAARADTVHGTLVDRATGKPVGGAIITIGSEIAASDDDGTFTVALPPGAYTAEIAAPFLVTAKIAVRATTAPVELGAITVEASAQVGGEVVEVHDFGPSTIGQTTVDAKVARAIPGGGDAAKVVQSMPAVARPQAGSAEVVVWGAAPQDTRTFVEGVPVPALYHVGGYRAAVGNDLIGDIRLTPAAFGVDRGGAIGGVIDIGLADPDKAPDWRIAADVLDTTIAGKVALPGGTVIAGAIRKSWLDRAIALVADPHTLAPNAPLPKWSDAQLAVRSDLGDRLVLTGFALGSLDALDRELVSDDPATATSEKIDRGSVRAAVALRRERDDGYDRAMLWAGRDRSLDDYAFGLVPASLHQRTWVAGARAVQQTRFADRATLTIGADVDGALAELSRAGSQAVPAREGDVHIFGLPPGDDVAADRWTATTVDSAAHAMTDVAIGPVIATAGVRVDGWLTGASHLVPARRDLPPVAEQDLTVTVDPRASVQASVSQQIVLRADAGRYHEARQASDTSAVFGTPSLGIEEAWHATAGGQWRATAAPVALEAAVYLRNLQDLVARDGRVTPPVAHLLTMAGTGRVRGVEVTARVVGYRGLSGWLSYNLSRSRRNDNFGEGGRYFDHDQTHGLIAVAGWEHGPWTLGGRVRYATGEPRTGVIGAFFDTRTGRFDPIRGPHNGERLPAYFAADARVERRFPLRGAKGAVYVELQNLTNRANAEEIIYNADFTQKGYLTGLPFLAIAGLRVEK